MSLDISVLSSPLRAMRGEPRVTGFGANFRSFERVRRQGKFVRTRRITAPQDGGQLPNTSDQVTFRD